MSRRAESDWEREERHDRMRRAHEMRSRGRKWSQIGEALGVSADLAKKWARRWEERHAAGD